MVVGVMFGVLRAGGVTLLVGPISPTDEAGARIGLAHMDRFCRVFDEWQWSVGAPLARRHSRVHLQQISRDLRIIYVAVPPHIKSAVSSGMVDAFSSHIAAQGSSSSMRSPRCALFVPPFVGGLTWASWSRHFPHMTLAD